MTGASRAWTVSWIVSASSKGLIGGGHSPLPCGKGGAAVSPKIRAKVGLDRIRGQ